MKITIDPKDKKTFVGYDYVEIQEEIDPLREEFKKTSEALKSPVQKRIEKELSDKNGIGEDFYIQVAKRQEEYMQQWESKRQLNIEIPFQLGKIYEYVDEESAEQIREKFRSLKDKYKGIDLEKYAYDFALIGKLAQQILENGGFYNVMQQFEMARVRKFITEEEEKNIDQFFIRMQEGGLDVSEIKFKGARKEDALTIKDKGMIKAIVKAFSQEYLYRVKHVGTEDWQAKLVEGKIPFILKRRTRQQELETKNYGLLFDIFFPALNKSDEFKGFTVGKRLRLLADIIFTFCKKADLIAKKGYKEEDYTDSEVYREYFYPKYKDWMASPGS